MRGDEQLVGLGEAAQALGITSENCAELIDRSSFPAPVAWLNARRVWLASDVDLYRRRRPQLDRRAGELQDDVLGAADVAALLGRAPASVRQAVRQQQWHLVPRPDGHVGQQSYWWRDKVNEFIAQPPNRS